MYALHRGEGTGWNPLVNILQARRINLSLGFPAVTPWDIEEMDEGTIEIYLSLSKDYSVMEDAFDTIEAKKRRWRADHPTYRKGRRH